MLDKFDKELDKVYYTYIDKESKTKDGYQLDINSMAMLLPGRTVQSIRNQVSYIRKRGYRFKT